MSNDYSEALRRADDLVARARFDLDKVPHPVMVVYLITQLDFEITNGGVAQWLTNSSGKYAVETAAALREVGASRCAALVDELMLQLGDQWSPLDEAKRSALVAALLPNIHSQWRTLADELLGCDDVDTLLRRYISANPTTFR